MNEDFDFAELQAADSVAERVRRRSLAQQQAEQATFLGALGEAAESRLAVQLDLFGGSTLSGTVVAVSDRLVQLVDDAGYGIAVAADAIEAVRSAGSTLLSGRPPDGGSGDMAAWLRDRWEWRSRVLLQTRGGHRYQGELTAVGRDVVFLQASSGVSTSCWIDVAGLAFARETPA